MATPYPKTRTVLVTGAGSGIGRATAHAFADEGAHVVAVGRREAALVETAGHDPSRISPLVADLTAADGPETVVRTALDRHGRLDVSSVLSHLRRELCMGIFDKFKSQARNKGKQGSDTAEERINERTGGKYEDQVDSGQQRVEGSLGMDRDRDRPEQQ